MGRLLSFSATLLKTHGQHAASWAVGELKAQSLATAYAYATKQAHGL